MIKNKELEVLNSLAEAWNKFISLPEIHSDDKLEFRTAIHTAQNIILARPTLRVLKNNESTN